MLSDLDAAILCERSYNEPATLEAADCHVLLVERDGVINAVFRGSASLLDWVRNLTVFGATTFDHEIVGLVPAGFLTDALAMVEPLKTALGDKPYRVVFHSKGAEGVLTAAILSAQGRPPVGIIGFGAPRLVGPGNTLLRPLLANIPCKSYRHRDDPVPLAPPGFGEAIPLIQLVAPRLELDVISDHFLAGGYIAALTLPAAA